MKRYRANDLGLKLVQNGTKIALNSLQCKQKTKISTCEVKLTSLFNVGAIWKIFEDVFVLFLFFVLLFFVVVVVCVVGFKVYSCSATEPIASKY